MADTLTREATTFIEKNRSQPFFLYFATHDIHVPRLPHPRFAGKSRMGPRGDVILEFDWCVGALLDVLDKNNRLAARNRARFAARGQLVLNLVSSPGSGKTTLLCKTIELLKGKVAISVVEGDQQTSNDAERIRATGVQALQINTGKGCHLDGHMVGHAMERLQPADDSLFLIENVGNLVCPAAFDLGEHHKVAILSVTEGEDKPLKYPDMFHAARLMIINKMDLLPYVDFDVDQAIAYARRINPQLQVLTVSATRGDGFDAWLAWLDTELGAVKQTRIDSLERELAQLRGA